MRIAGKVTNGNMPFMRAILHEIQSHEGKIVEVVVRLYKKKTTPKQLNYYFAAVIPAVDGWLRESGIVESKEDIHEYLMKCVGKYTTISHMPDGTIMEKRRSIRDLSTKECNEYVDLVKLWASERGVYIEDPYYTGEIK